jgi:hypothetical protein
MQGMPRSHCLMEEWMFCFIKRAMRVLRSLICHFRSETWAWRSWRERISDSRLLRSRGLERSPAIGERRKAGGGERHGVANEGSWEMGVGVESILRISGCWSCLNETVKPETPFTSSWPMWSMANERIWATSSPWGLEPSALGAASANKHELCQLAVIS